MKNLFNTLLINMLVIATATAVELPSIDKTLGGKWTLLDDHNKGQIKVVTINDEKVVKLEAATDSWVAMRRQLTGIQAGETIEFEADVLSPNPKVAAIITTGFIWGSGDPSKGKLTKVYGNGNGQWQTVKCSIRILREPVTIGIGLENNSGHAYVLIKSVKIRREKEILQMQLRKFLTFQPSQDNPPEIQKYFHKLNESMTAIAEKLRTASGKTLSDLIPEIKKQLKQVEKVVILVNGQLNPEFVDNKEDTVDLALFNLWSRHSVWYRIVCEPENQVNMLQGNNVGYYPLNEANLILIPSGSFNRLRITAPPGEYKITIQPLDYNESPVKRHLKIRICTIRI